MTEIKIDINYDFHKDNKKKIKEWDPDKQSENLWDYHSVLWKKEKLKGLRKAKTEKRGKETISGYLKLDIEDKNSQNGKIMLTLRSDNFEALYRNYERYNNYEKYKKKDKIDNYKKIKTAMDSKKEWKYVIGGSLIFPAFKKEKGRQTINQSRGINKKVADRIDITLLCIKLWYEKKEENAKNPLKASLDQPENKKFFRLFGEGEEGFRNYVDFFFMNDFVNDDYEPINLFDKNREKLDEKIFGEKSEKEDEKKSIYPEKEDEWNNLYENLKTCITKRSERIWNDLKDNHLTDEKDFHFVIERQKNG